MKILLIEDDEVLCKTIQMSLTKAGYDTEICHTGTDGFLYACSGARPSENTFFILFY